MKTMSSKLFKTHMQLDAWGKTDVTGAMFLWWFNLCIVLSAQHSIIDLEDME